MSPVELATRVIECVCNLKKAAREFARSPHNSDSRKARLLLAAMEYDHAMRAMEKSFREEGKK